jgi:phospholipid-translocating ATPase
VARTIKEITGKRIACVGDGGNDVAMIQDADVGLGIVGKEGMQASLAADYSVLSFKDLTRLILWHGRLSYKRSAALSQFVIHRGMIISFIQAIFTCVYFFVTIPIYNGFLMLGYSTVYTSLPVFSIILDEDCDWQKVRDFPALYLTLQLGRSLNFKTFMIWTWKSLMQATVIMFGVLLFFEESFLYIVTITFTTLIFCETLNIYSTVSKIRPMMLVSTVITLIVYMISIVVFRQYLQLTYLTWSFMGKVILLSLASWAPLHFIKIIIQCLDPN